VIGDINAGDPAAAAPPSVPNSDLVADDVRRRALSVPNVVQEIADRFTALARLRAALQAEIAELEAAGMYDEVPAESWENRNGGGKYLRLIFPQHDGTRRKVYVGAYPSAIAEARAKIARRQRYEELTRNLARLDLVIGQAERKLAEVARDLGGALRSWGQAGG
jgi:hypothetical protein